VAYKLPWHRHLLLFRLMVRPTPDIAEGQAAPCGVEALSIWVKATASIRQGRPQQPPEELQTGAEEPVVSESFFQPDSGRVKYDCKSHPSPGDSEEH
jgi:hypothetical protein